MKLYCELCKKVQPVRIDNCRDAKTNKPYQDIVCAECDLVIASGTDIAQPEQEPETVMAKYGFQTYAAYKADGEMKIGVVPEPKAWVTAGRHTVPLEVAPPKREWVGLTRTERFEIQKSMSKYYDYQHECKTVCLPEFAAAIEAKLKEKNS